LPAYRLPSPYDRAPLRRRAASFALALAINVGLLLLLIELGVVAVPQPRSRTLSVDLMPESRSASAEETKNAVKPHVRATAPVPKPPPIVIPSKPTIAQPPRNATKPWIEMSSDELAAADISKLPTVGAGGAGDSEVIGHGPHGEVLYRAEWARRPTDAELGGYLPKDARDGAGVIACKTIPDDRVDDCIEIENDPPGSHLASAVRQAAWQFHVRPPRKNGVPMIGQWVLIEIDYGVIREE
jgi:periplasmic protein TonB